MLVKAFKIVGCRADDVTRPTGHMRTVCVTDLSAMVV